MNKPRFVTESQLVELVHYYHLARTALADKPLEERTPYRRRLWASAEFAKANPSVSPTAAYKDLDSALS